SNEHFRDNLNNIFNEYSDIKDELADDDSLDITKQALDLKQAVLLFQTESASERSGHKWRIWVSSAEIIISDLKLAKTLDLQRKSFSELSSSIEAMIQSFGLKGKTIYKVECTGLKQKNNFWLTDSKNNLNPYYGKDRSNERSKSCIHVIKKWEFD